LRNQKMLRSHLRLIAVLTTVILCSPVFWSVSAHAQFGDDQGQDSGDAGSNGSGDNGDGTGLDAAEAFSGLQRGNEVGVTENTGKGFSDSSVAPPTAGGGNVTPGGIGGGLGGFGGVGGFGSQFDSANGSAAEALAPVIRTRLRSAIRVQPRPPMQVQRIATGRFRSYPNRSRLGGITISMQGRTAVLEGTVGIESDRRMSHLLMRLEPGVSQVENRVVVGP
jgi:hypothetical protein